MIAITLELSEVEARERHPVIPTIANPSGFFRDYVATRRELQAADAGVAALEERGNSYRRAEAAAQKLWSRMLDFAYAIKDRTIESEQDLLELAIIVADSDNGTAEEGATYRVELVQALLNRILERGAGERNQKAA